MTARPVNLPRCATRPVRRVRAVWAWALGCAALLACGLAAAQPVDRTIQQFHHTSWDAKSGAPLNTWKMAQTTDGWLWLGGLAGLYRFDGVRFERFDDSGSDSDRTGSVSNLLALPSGELWIGYYYGGVGVLANGRLERFGSESGFDGSPVLTIEYDHDGNIWAATASDLLRYDGHRWDKAGPRWDLKLATFGGMVVDAAGTLWVVNQGRSGERLYAMRRGAARFELIDGAPSGGRSFQVLDGALWMVHADHARRVTRFDAVAGAVADPRPNSRRSSSLVIDRERQLWTAFCPQGLCRTRLPERLDAERVPLLAPWEHFTHRDGLSGDIGMTILEDRSGTIWVATKSGLDRFRRANLRRLDLPSAMTNFALVRSPREGVLIAGLSATARALWRADLETFVVAEPPARIDAAHVDRSGQVWFGGPGGLWLRTASGFEAVPAPEALGQVRVRALASDHRGLWVSFTGAGLYRLEGREWRRETLLDAPNVVTALATGRDERLWLGFAENRLAVLDEGRLRYFDASDGIAVGAVGYLHAGRLLIAAGQDGIAILRGERFRTMNVADPEVLRGVSGIVETARGDLWLNGVRGAVRIDAADVERWQEDPARRVPVQLFDAQDGYPTSASPGTPQPSAILGDDGRIWFAGIDGVAWIDPDAIERPDAAPPVMVRDLVANGRRYDASQPVQLPSGTTSVAIRYTALALAAPERMVFRHRLDGVDEGWRQAGPRREVVYSNLGPGRYTFRVGASEAGDARTPAEASVSIEIAPTFTQSLAFRAVVAGALALLLVAAYRVRVNVLAQRAATRMQAVLNERERIARELHDTLLQGVQGLVLQFQAVADSLGPGRPERALIDTALERADRVLAEGRDRIADLRTMTEPGDDLASALRCFGEQLAAEHGIAFSMSVHGEPNAADPLLLCEVYRIACEALLNAFQHAQASQVDLALRCEREMLRVTVRDDGVGISEKMLAEGKPGHWGLAGMRERARRIRGQLSIARGANGGTEVAIELPVIAVRDDPARRGLLGRAWRRLRRDPASSGA